MANDGSDVFCSVHCHKPTFSNVWTFVKNTYAMILLIFSTTIIMGLIATRQTEVSSKIHPALAYVLIWGAVLWLTMVEGGQASIVGLAPVNEELFKESHPKAYKTIAITNKGDNLDRYLLGRQFMVVLVVFTINISGAPLPGAELWGLPSVITEIFLVTGFAMILYTCMIGQLTSQVNAAHCMLDYIDNYFALFTLYVAMFIEWTGLLHASYLVQMLVGKLAGKPIESNEPPRDVNQNIFFWFRCTFSLGCLAFALACTIEAIFKGKTTMWAGVPNWVTFILLFVILFIVGMLEGMQIAFFAVTKIPVAERGDSKIAKAVCKILFRNNGHNLAGFMIGRQLTVVSSMFVGARVTSITDEGGNLFGVSDGLQSFFRSGFLGAFIITILGSISWQLVASAFPIQFLSNPITYVLLRIALILEGTGICSGAWVLAAVQKMICGFQRDEVYIGTAEERARAEMEDHASRLRLGAGHPVKPPGVVEDMEVPKVLQDLVDTDPEVATFMSSIRKAKADEIGTTEKDSGDDDDDLKMEVA